MRKIHLTILVPVLFACVGCQTDSLARQLICPNVGAGKLAIAMKGSGEELVQRGIIDLHRRIETADKVTIDVWVMHGRPPGAPDRSVSARGTVVILHGLSESKGSFPYLGAAKRLKKMGYDVVLPDLRRHGRSTGKYVTYGTKEKRDVKTVVDSLIAEKQIASTVYVFGVNLGAATAIQYAAIDDKCKGVMAIAPYQDFASIARRSMLLLPREDFEKILQRAGQLGGFDPQNASAVKAAAQLKCPLLVVHGYGLLDASVPREHSEAIIAAAPEPKKLIGKFEDVLRTMTTEDWIADNINELATRGLD